MGMTESIRIFVDTSVFGGVHDPKFQTASRALLDEVKAGRFYAVISSVVLDELRNAPEPVRACYLDMRRNLEVLTPNAEALRLSRAYLEAAIVGERWGADTLHVAVATVSGCRAIVSWNFRHIVHFQKIPMYNGVNMTRGYGPLAIHTPQEMLHYEDNVQDL